MNCVTNVNNFDFLLLALERGTSVGGGMYDLRWEYASYPLIVIAWLMVWLPVVIFLFRAWRAGCPMCPGYTWVLLFSAQARSGTSNPSPQKQTTCIISLTNYTNVIT
jgi:hypothetical protein